MRRTIWAGILLIMAVLMFPSKATRVSAAAATEIGISNGNELITYTESAQGQGSDGGSWSWDGAGTLTLNNYSGGRIYAEGDLTVILEGTNTIQRASDANNPNRPGLMVENGDLLITDDGQGDDSLEVSVQDYHENMRNGGAIRTHKGNMTIQGTSVTVEWNAYIIDGNLPSGAIFALGGNVSIENASVNAHVRNDHNGTVAAIMASAYNNGMSIDSTEGGSVYIRDSRVDARADRYHSSPVVQTIYGIYAFSNIPVTPVIQITNSEVAPYGAGAPSIARAMFAMGQYSGNFRDETPALGDIIIDDASVFPPGFYVEPYEFINASGVLYSQGEDAHYAELYSVNYTYEGDIPENAPVLPDGAEYLEGETVEIAEAPAAEGYIFSGWTTDSVEITEGSFVMPAADVVLTGTWTKEPEPETYQVVYEYEGDVPESAPALPSIEEYLEGDTVTIASEPALEGYTFSGWMTDGIDISEGSFQMPAHNVIIRGSWEKEKTVITVPVKPEENTPESPKSQEPPAQNKVPETGDMEDILPVILAAVLGIASIMGSILVRRRQTR